MATIIGARPNVATVTWPGLSIASGANQQRALSPLTFQAPAAGYITRIGAVVREISGSNPRMYGVVWALDQDGTPGEMLGRTDRQDVNGTVDWNFPVAWSDPDLKGALTAIRVTAGQRFAIGLKNQDGTIEVARLTGSTMFWLRNVGSASPPTDPFSPTSTSMDTPVALYVEFSENRLPVAALTAPANGSAVNTTTPTISGTFTDPDQAAPIVDRMSAYALQVIRVADGQEMWGGAGAVFAASPAERAANTFSRVYGGTALPPGSGPYSVQARVIDDSGAQSDWSTARTFTVNAAGQVYTGDAVNPPAKVETASNLIDWDAKWFHPTALAMNAAKVRVRIAGTQTVVKEGALVTKAAVSSASPGTAFTIQDTEAGIGTLEPGSYEYDVQGRASDGQFSPWSDGRLFIVNAPPTQPSNLQPPDGSSSTVRPELRWNVTDPDENFGTNGQSRIQFIRPNGSTIEVVTTNYDAVAQQGFYTPNTTDVLDAVLGAYRWRVRGEDVSAGTAGEGPWSPYQTFSFTAGPVVTITNPATDGTVVTTSTPTVAWTASGQARFRVQVYVNDAAAPFRAYDGVGSGTTFQIPAGWLVNNGDYDLDITSWDGSNNKGTSLRRNFHVAYAGPAIVTNIQGSPYGNRLDPIIMGVQEASSVFLSWLESTINPGEFGGYVVRRRIQGQALSEAIRFPTITTPGQARWWDHMAPPNVPLVYSVSQLRRVSAEETLESDVAELEITLTRQVPMLCSAKTPGDLRIAGMWIDGDNMGGDYLQDQALEKTWGSGQKRVHMAPPAAYGARTVQLTVVIRADERADLDTHLDAIDDLVEAGHPLLWSPRRNRERMFCVIEGSTKWKMDGIGRRSRSFNLVEIDWTEGVKENLSATDIATA